MSERAPEAVLSDFLHGATKTKALAIAADLDVATAVADRPRPVAELARALGVDADVLQRVLRALAGDGIFAEVEPGVFAHTPASEVLRQQSWRDIAHLFGGIAHRAVAELDHGVATGRSPFADTFGAGFWTWLAERPEERASFDRAMGGGKQRTAARLAELEWRDGEVVVDVGGGNGALLVELLRLRPALRGVVFDLPETDRDEVTLGERIEFVAGSFFERVPRGDTYVLAGILHDWDDEPAAAILRTIQAAAPAGARVLVLESVLEPGNEPSSAKWLDLVMLALVGGRERDERQWRELLDGTGFAVEAVQDLLVEARRR
jgi:O-methyltransferase